MLSYSRLLRSGRNFHTSIQSLQHSGSFVFPNKELTKTKFIFDKNTHTVEQITNNANSFENSNIVINGWLEKKPKKIGKNLIFATLRDTNGDTIQLVDSESLLKYRNVEDVVQIRGKLSAKRKAASSNGNVKEYEIKLSDINVLNSSNEKPAQLKDQKLSGIYPPEYRVLQLRLPSQQLLLKRKNEVSKLLRNLLDKENFVEIETPTLFKPTPEGAREFLVPTRSGKFYALTQSPQQYKQMLIAGGVTRYFQLARCFRDEDMRKDRQPEFTQLDLEMGFANGEDIMYLIQNLICETWSKFAPLSNKQLMTLNNSGKLKDVNSGSDIYRMTYKEAMTKYGIDKPDLRAPNLKIMSLREFNIHSYQNLDFPIFEVIIIRNAVKSKEDYNNHWARLLQKDDYSNRVPIGVPILSDADQTNWFNSFSEVATFENPILLNKSLRLQKGDVIFGSSRESDSSIFENPTPLGRLRQLILNTPKGQELFYETKNDVATWVVDFPLFSPVVSENKKMTNYPEYENKLCSTHHPFTMVKLDDYDNLREHPLQVRGQHYDFVMNGVELGGGSTRVHDPELQDFIFENILKISNAKELFGHLLEALAMGAPPHAGFAIGFERMCAMLFGRESIRDVLAFPKSVSGVDLVVKSPAFVEQDVLKPYNIQYIPSKKNSEAN
ncbi:similar to Saccharomyces cerevisiae YPL104W MSD1 Mitochondrial aspartyl-tRNA synthetase, required for acylation of aspartyl-tRNA [Maudiozyma barnettii]|uniref:Similar to Saccharomyces cerevisiae YPL104W MSD1 Mitochondrial aspartyl-tRNA synthetase, required for acylation of aspartyl-tRNA n=1 Tax=Maudiozyma barnettii TaxID=61262 RepID=A0A8H2VHJ0_9SACH|nr:aspartate--tRNA ligase MSD1 [Kazachstania barnettii]CAB4255784.1 similar to Saccharomyces cerevisiae YPL104W MSD1 Mitochondrial aspartyl-tRNA synthetase, required for acylation of aspartyl-tRNA [Kazachstania barnettii]CAD1784345.1 similar to Saccharomyces cerevisiae YPL104W MSD1 Mitochondrial aspartyl-tRNA synthetase, required for acylation of aspartyl-tRNA [Kazachstania barnettii]